MTKTKKTITALGISLTYQRMCILKTIQERFDHPDPEMVFNAVRMIVPSVSPNTVYRTLALFCEKGIIQQLAVPTRRFRYDGNPKPHDHFFCTRCETILDLPASREPAATLPETVRAVGEVFALQRVYTGRCHSCLLQLQKTQPSPETLSADAEELSPAEPN